MGETFYILSVILLQKLLGSYLRPGELAHVQTACLWHAGSDAPVQPPPCCPVLPGILRGPLSSGWCPLVPWEPGCESHKGPCLLASPLNPECRPLPALPPDTRLPGPFTPCPSWLSHLRFLSMTIWFSRTWEQAKLSATLTTHSHTHRRTHSSRLLLLRHNHWVCLAQRIRDWGLCLFSASKATGLGRTGLITPSAAESSLQPKSGKLCPRPLAPLSLPLPRMVPCTQLPRHVRCCSRVLRKSPSSGSFPRPSHGFPLKTVFQGPAQVPLLWELSTALPRLLPEDSAPGTSRHLWTEHAAGVGVLTVTSDPRADLGGLQSLFSCDINYLKFWECLYSRPQTLIYFVFLFPFW